MKRELKIGDKVVVVCGLKSEKCKFYDMGDTGIIKELRPDGVLVDFRNQENKEVYGTGVYLMREEYLSNWIKQDPKPRFHAAQPGDDVYCRLKGNGIIMSVIPFLNNRDAVKALRIRWDDGNISNIELDGRHDIKHKEATVFYRNHSDYYLTERPEPEVDWSKVPSGVDVKVSNVHQKDALKNLKYTLGYKFMGYFPDLVLPFWVFRTYEKTEAFGVKFCALAEPCKPEWRK